MPRFQNAVCGVQPPYCPSMPRALIGDFTPGDVMRRNVTLLCLCALLFVCASSWAQEVTGSIAGTVKDPQGAVVPNAKVTLTDSDKNVDIRSMNTGGSGEFSFPGLSVGRYQITVESPNFQKFVQSGIALNVNDKLTFYPTL